VQNSHPNNPNVPYNPNNPNVPYNPNNPNVPSGNGQPQIIGYQANGQPIYSSPPQQQPPQQQPPQQQPPVYPQNNAAYNPNPAYNTGGQPILKNIKII
jgi:hypothetical protein